jgi:hypothetical protein
MKFKQKPIKRKPFILLDYLHEHPEMFADYDKKILSGEATELQKEILKCYQDDDYFSTLSEEERNKIFEELTRDTK